MEAVFAKDVRELFSSPSTPKTYYHPTAVTGAGKKTSKPVPSIKTPSTALKKTHLKVNVLSALPPSPSPSSPPAPVWDLKHTLSPPPLPDLADTSSGGSSRFNESWPSVCGGEGVAKEGGEVPVGGAECVEEQRSMDDISMDDRGNSTLARYIERFRHGPPTDRTQRAAPGGTFWWRGQEDAEGGGATWERGGANQEGVVGDIPPTGASTPGDKSHTHTDPSPAVSSEVSLDGAEDTNLDSRSQDLLEKCSTLFDMESPPAQKYLNTLRVREEPPRDVGVVEGCGFSQRQPDTDDILAQWRLRRKLEQARTESKQVACSPPGGGRGLLVEPHPPGHEGGSGGWAGSEQERELGMKQVTEVPQHPCATMPLHTCVATPLHTCLTTPPHCMCALCYHHHLTTPTCAAIHLSATATGTRREEVREQEVQPAPGLLDRQQTYSQMLQCVVEDHIQGGHHNIHMQGRQAEGHEGEQRLTSNTPRLVTTDSRPSHLSRATPTSTADRHVNRESLTPSPTPDGVPLVNARGSLTPSPPPQVNARGSLTASPPPQVNARGSLTPSPPPQVNARGSLTPSPPPQVNARGSLTPSPPPQVNARGSLTASPPPQVNVRGLLTPSPPPQVNARGLLTPSPPPQVNAGESLTPSPPPQVNARGSLTASPPPQVNVRGSLTPNPPPQVNARGSLTPNPPPQVNARGSLTASPPPQVNVRGSLTPNPPPQVNARGSLTPNPPPQVNVRGSLTPSPLPQVNARGSLTPNPTFNSTPLPSGGHRSGRQAHHVSQLPPRGSRATPPPVRLAPPTHGGLALRDISDDEDTLFSVTFDTELDTSCAESALGHHPSPNTTSKHHHMHVPCCVPVCHVPVCRGALHMSEPANMPTSRQQSAQEHSFPAPSNTCRQYSNEEEAPSYQPTPPTHFTPALSPRVPPQRAAGVTSEGLLTPLQKAADLEPASNGFQDMGDELLKFLLSKARLFEGQIREIDCLLMALQEEGVQK